MSLYPSYPLAVDLDLGLVRVGLRPVPRNLLPGRKPDIVLLREVLHNVLQRLEATGPADPPRVKRDGDVGAFAVHTFLTDHAGGDKLVSDCRMAQAHSKAFLARSENAESEPSCPSQYLKSLVSRAYGMKTMGSSGLPPGMGR